MPHDPRTLLEDIRQAAARVQQFTALLRSADNLSIRYRHEPRDQVH